MNPHKDLIELKNKIESFVRRDIINQSLADDSNIFIH